MKKALLAITVLFLQLPPYASGAEVVVVPAPADSADPASTPTLVFEVAEPQITLIVMPGGEGRLGLKDSSTFSRNPTTQMAARLADSGFSNVHANVVAMDTPRELFPLSLRAEPAHLSRMAGVVEYFRRKYARPVWLLGHSAGTLSVSEYLRKMQADVPVAGAVLSGSMYLIKLPDALDIPLLFLHHESDECRSTPAGYAREHYEEAKRINRAPTELLLVTGGESKGDPCRDGRHMYYGVNEEAAKLLAGFIGRTVR